MQHTSAGLLAVRTVAITSTFALGTSLAARSDTAHAAAHQICLQLWLASSLLADSLAIAAQTLLAQGVAGKELGQARKVRSQKLCSLRCYARILLQVLHLSLQT
jgi:Na+-driven multidrug efflux pump